MSKGFPKGFRKLPPRKGRIPIPPSDFDFGSEKVDYRRSKQRRLEHEIIDEALDGDDLNPVCPICYAVVPEAEFENHVHSCAESGNEGGR